MIKSALGHPSALDDRGPVGGRVPHLTENVDRGVENLPVVSLAIELAGPSRLRSFAMGIESRTLGVQRCRTQLRRQDSNLNSQNQNLMCCRLHHDGPRTSGEQAC